MSVDRKTACQIRELKLFRDKVRKLWEKGEIKCPVHLPGGNEEELVSLFKEIGHSDYVFATHRNMYHALLKGVPRKKLLHSILGGLHNGEAVPGNCMGVIYPEHRFYTSSIVAGTCAIAVGVGLALKEKGSRNKVWCFIGDGATDEGHFYEALRYVVGHDLPVVFVVEDNDRATCTSDDIRWGKVTSGEMCSRLYSSHLRYYYYQPTTPHVGSGKYVQF